MKPQFKSHPKEASPITACRFDPRFCYSFRRPAEITPDTPILVAIHGNMRSLERTRDAFADFAGWNDCVVIAPLFPVGILGDNNKDGFKFLIEGDIRYDLVLLQIVEEVTTRLGLSAERFGLFGFAGGAQFTNCFMLLHAQRLWAACIAAPGSVTLLDFERLWWLGVADLEAQFGTSVDLAALRDLPIQLLVGTADVDPGTDQTSLSWMPGGRDAGETAYARLLSLSQSLEAQGISPELCLVPRKGHELLDLVDSAKHFFRRHLDHARHSHAAQSDPLSQTKESANVTSIL
ncbi:alpha/beta hydrolase [Alphaproteobacteria bacterium KMM 3653]|uniref:Alpha/beta hydrolase n=1 Tax=Harenicola maris TaxID=2841044 RepID=A0AAP2CST7_9RHOB|nr:alpha/beta hydrolase [Harenicola maris]